jgi:glucosamine--fructose-6-phosphate aminotransferase (isomerizing)
MSETLFEQDVLQTARSLEATLTHVRDAAMEVASRLRSAGVERIAVLGNGTSLYASQASTYLHNALASPRSTAVWAMHTGEYAQYPVPLAENDALVAVSVSGELNDLLEVCERAKGRHHVIGLTNIADSSLTRLVDHVLLMQAGRSLVPTSTKTFVTSVATLQLLWLGLAELQGNAEAADLRRQLLATPSLVEQSMEEARAQLAPAADRLDHCERLFVLGSGPAYALAQEFALVFREVANLPADAVQTREMVQGPIAVVDKTVGIVAISAPGPSQAVTKQTLAQCAEVGAVTLEVGDTAGGLRISAQCHDLLIPITYGGPLFLLANELGVRRGVDVDHPRWESIYLVATRR